MGRLSGERDLVRDVQLDGDGADGQPVTGQELAELAEYREYA